MSETVHDYFTGFEGYAAQQCLDLNTTSQQVTCSSQHLNVTDPPSDYTYNSYPTIWEPIFCYLYNVTYSDRVDQRENYNFCPVPLTGYDAFLFASLALILGALLMGRLSAVMLLISGGIIGLINYYCNMYSLSNSIALWLNVQPATLFFYAFLPPLLLEAALKVDMFLFKKLWIHSILWAFIMVFITCAVVAVFILYVLGFDGRGWTWVQAALFAAIVAPTDCVSVAAILKTSGGPEKLVCLLESESLWNDASAFTLFEVLSHILLENYNECAEEDHCSYHNSAAEMIPRVLLEMLILGSIGIGMGLALSIITQFIMRWLRWRGARPYVESIFVLAMGFLTFWVTNSPAHGSGVIAIVVFGLYGNATSKWGMLSSEEYHVQFEAAWDAISFGLNSLIFFWSGVSAVNFLIRSSVLLTKDAWSFAAIPILYIGMIVLRTSIIALFAPLYRLAKAPLTWQEMLFCGWAGLRGAVSLMLIASLTTSSNLFQGGNGDDDVIYSTIAIWTASFVFLTLVINAPTLPYLMRLLKLDVISVEKKKTRDRAKRALIKFTDEAIQSLKEDDDEFLSGADWVTVGSYVDMAKELPEFDYNKKQSKTAADENQELGGVGAAAAALSFIQFHDLSRKVLISTKTMATNSDSGASIKPPSIVGLPLEKEEEDDDDDVDDDDVKSWSSNMSASELLTEMQTECMWLGDSNKVSKAEAKKDPFREENGEVGDIEKGLDDGEMCFSGAQAARLGSQLRLHLSKSKEEEEDDDDSNSTIAEQHYMSLPVGAAKSLSEQLKQQQQLQQQDGSSPSSVPARHSTIDQSSNTMPATLGAQLGRDLKSHLAENRKQQGLPSSSVDHSSTMPAAVGAQLGKDLKSYLSRSSANMQRDITSWDAYQDTVTGASGKHLASELKRQSTFHASTSIKRDLLGKRNSSRNNNKDDSGASTMENFQQQRQQALLPLSSMLERKASNVHVLKRQPITTTSAVPTKETEMVDLSVRGGMAAAATAVSSREEKTASREQLDEWRHRLIAGMLRYFHAKRNEGLLSTTSLRVLEYACETQLDESIEKKSNADVDDNINKLTMWATLEKEVRSSWATRAIARLLFSSAKWYCALPAWLQSATRLPFKKFTGFLLGHIGNKLLVACEVSVEYFMALRHSHQVKWARTHEEAWQLNNEIEAEAEVVKKFIIEREVEAPDRFNSIQSYRAAMAVLRRQAAFVQELFETGMLDPGERGKMMSPLDRKMRRLELTGPVWRPPRPIDVLRSLPALSYLPDSFFRKIRLLLSFTAYTTGEQIWSSDSSRNTGLFVVVSGIVKRTIISSDTDGGGGKNLDSSCTTRHWYHGAGGMIGVLRTMTGLCLPNMSETVIAEGNALGKGAALYRLPSHFRQWLDSEIALGVDGAQALKEELFKLAAVYVINNTEETIINLVTDHVVMLILSTTTSGVGGGHPSSSSNRNAAPVATLKQLQLPPLPPSSSGGGGGQLSSSTPTQQQGSFHRVKSSIERTLSTVPSVVARILEEDWEEEDEEQKKRNEEEEMAVVEQRPSVPVLLQGQDLTADIGKPKQALPSRRALKAETVEIIAELKFGCSTAKLCVVTSGVVIPIKSHIVLLQGSLVNTSRDNCKHQAPCVIPWLWNPELACTNKHCPVQKLVELCNQKKCQMQTGPEGASFLVYGNDDGSAIPSALEAIDIQQHEYSVNGGDDVVQQRPSEPKRAFSARGVGGKLLRTFKV